MEKQKSLLMNKREQLRNQIRRSNLQQKFKKIRVQMSSRDSIDGLIYKQNQQNIKLANQILQIIENNIYYFPKTDSQGEKMQFLWKFYDEQLKQPDQTLNNLLLSQPIVQAIHEKWTQMAKWQYQCGEIVQKIIKQIALSLSIHTCKQKILDFLLQTIKTLIYGNKIKILKQKISKQQKPVYLVGRPEQNYKQILLLRCYNTLMNFTYFEEEQYILPFLVKISNVIRKSSYFSQIYLNIFLTERIPSNQKLQMFTHFIQFLENNRLAVIERFQMYIQILYVIYTNPPFMTKIKISNDLASLNINYRVIKFLQSCLKALDFKIEEFITKDPYSPQFRVIYQLSIIFLYLVREQQYVLSKIPHQQYIIRFFIKRLTTFQSIPQKKCLHVILQAICYISCYGYIFKELQQRNTLFWIYFTRAFDSLGSELFIKKEVNGTNQFNNDGQFPALKCLNGMLKILNILSVDKNYCFRLFKQNFVKKIVFIYKTIKQNQNLQNFRKIQSYCLQIMCRLVFFLIDSQPQLQQQLTQQNIGYYLFANFFSEQTNFQQVMMYELGKIAKKDIIRNEFSKSLIIELLLSLFSVIDLQIQNQLSQISFTEQPIYKNSWFTIYYEFMRVKNQDLDLQKLIQLIYYTYQEQNNQNKKLSQLANKLLNILNKIQQDLKRANIFQKNLIYQQKDNNWQLKIYEV